MDWLRDIPAFLWAVVNNWAAYATGGLIVALVTLWTWIRQSSVSKRTGIALTLLFLFLAFFNAWREQKRTSQAASKRLDETTKPKFMITAFSSVNFITKAEDQTFMFLSLKIINAGADSAVLGFSAHYRSATLDQEVQLFNMTTEFRADTPFGPFILRPEDNIMSMRGVILRGDQRVGKLPVMLPGNRLKEIAQGAQLVVSVFDYLGTTYTATWTGGPDSKGPAMYAPGEAIPPGSGGKRF